MVRLWLRRSLVLVIALSACLSAFAGLAVVNAAPPPGAPPVGINPSHPAVAGILVAKPVPAEGNRPILCRDQDRTAAARALLVNRGLVICTGVGTLVLLQLSGGTKLADRNWDALTISQMNIGDHIRAWGVLTQGGFVLNPTFAVQDISQPRGQAQTVTGILIAKPVPGAGNRPILCRDQNRTAEVRALLPRGLVICTEEARLVLLQLSTGTRIVAQDGTAATVGDLTDGDRIVARGQLRDNGMLMDPTFVVRDSDIQSRATESQDFIAKRNVSLTLYVLQSAAGGPVQGIIQAERGNDTRVILCEGRTGAWGNLAEGMTIDVSSSVFNRRTMTYVDTGVVRVVSCR